MRRFRHFGCSDGVSLGSLALILLSAACGCVAHSVARHDTLFDCLNVFFHGEAATGTLAACWSLVGLANLFVNGIENFLTPKPARAYIEGGIGELSRILRWANGMCVLVVGLICLTFLVGGGQLVVLVFGAKYAGTWLIVLIFALSVLVRSLGIAGNGLWALEHPEANFVADVCTLISTLGLAVCLIPLMSVLGAAVATLVGATVGTIMRCLSLRHILHSSTGKITAVA